jgi:lipopolysaccharide transport system permease protein
VTKVYFPRLLAPTSATFPGLVDLGVSYVGLAVLMAIFKVAPTPAIVTSPLWLLALMVAALGIGLVLGTLNVTYRDVNQAIALLLQLWMFVTPVAYPSSLVPASWRPLYFVNPMAGVVEGFRWALVGTPWPGNEVFISLTISIVMLVGGVVYFEHAERRFADVI